MAVSESEYKIDRLKKDNENLRNRLNDLQIASEGQDEKQVPEEIRVLKEEIEQVEYRS
jgi:hypothetical protein